MKPLARFFYLTCVAALLLSSCGHKSVNEPPVLDAIRMALTDTSYLYHWDTASFPGQRTGLPIGIFDSGTGGLTVMEALLAADNFENITGAAGRDGIRDFSGERFVYLADQANMPYGNYSSEDKSEYLRELVVKDALFLLNGSGHEPVKTIVIACNTATAYGLDDIQTLLKKSGTNVKVTGVIQAGVKACLENLGKDEDAAVGVLATVGTIASGGYERALRNMASQMGYTGKIQVVSQGAMGFAEAVDGEKDYVNKGLFAPNKNYRGPSLEHKDYPIDKDLLPAYNFDFGRNYMLYAPSRLRPTVMQLNAAQNYARYHLLSLVEKLRQAAQPQVLKCLIMGCTHYPYYAQTLREMLEELRDYRKDGRYVYRDLIAEKVVLIDPAVETAKEVYKTLEADGLLAHSVHPTAAQYFISVPMAVGGEENLDTLGRFTYGYKYGRNPGQRYADVCYQPFSSENVEMDVYERLRQVCPYCYRLIQY